MADGDYIRVANLNEDGDESQEILKSRWEAGGPSRAVRIARYHTLSETKRSAPGPQADEGEDTGSGGYEQVSDQVCSTRSSFNV